MTDVVMMEQILRRLAEIERKVEQMPLRFDEIDRKIDIILGRLAAVERAIPWQAPKSGRPIF